MTGRSVLATLPDLTQILPNMASPGAVANARVKLRQTGRSTLDYSGDLDAAIPRSRREVVFARVSLHAPSLASYGTLTAH